ncbi:MAG: small multi-drug export protein [Candidatus Atribacteria bacterium]|nr:small multi-drug export protein [Candidatus Atribacteria bacterium]MCD6349209.1 small multi-drug export protein [Candidatus Atribacteria bacterium]
MIAILPISELRGAIPYGVLVEKLPWLSVIVVSGAANLIPFFAIMTLAPHLEILLNKNPYFKKKWLKLVESSRKRFFPYRKFGKWGILFFIGIPLPFTGVWTGSLACWLLGFSIKESLIYVLGGITMATAIVATVTKLGGQLL